MIRPPPSSPLFPYPPLSRSVRGANRRSYQHPAVKAVAHATRRPPELALDVPRRRSEEHTSELQSQSNLVCRLLLEKKKKKTNKYTTHSRTTSMMRHTEQVTL